jgi:hypothetical protein
LYQAGITKILCPLPTTKAVTTITTAKATAAPSKNTRLQQNVELFLMLFLYRLPNIMVLERSTKNVSLSCTDKKENQIFLINKEIQKGAVAKSYMTTASSYMVNTQTEKSSTVQNEVFPLLLATVVIFSADLKSFLSHLLNVHFPITRSSLAFLKKKVMFLC